MPFSNNQGQLTSKSEVDLAKFRTRARHFMVVLVNYKNEERLLKNKEARMAT